MNRILFAILVILVSIPATAQSQPTSIMNRALRATELQRLVKVFPAAKIGDPRTFTGTVVYVWRMLHPYEGTCSARIRIDGSTAVDVEVGQGESPLSPPEQLIACVNLLQAFRTQKTVTVEGKIQKLGSPETGLGSLELTALQVPQETPIIPEFADSPGCDPNNPTFCYFTDATITRMNWVSGDTLCTATLRTHRGLDSQVEVSKPDNVEDRARTAEHMVSLCDMLSGTAGTGIHVSIHVTPKDNRFRVTEIYVTTTPITERDPDYTSPF
jgi:hypothetical protein